MSELVEQYQRIHDGFRRITELSEPYSAQWSWANRHLGWIKIHLDWAKEQYASDRPCITSEAVDSDAQ